MEDMKLLMGRIAVICRIVALPNEPSNTPRDKIRMGKTRVQKLVYFLQEGSKLPLEYYFKMHYYGPYSERLEDRLALAKAMGYVDITLDEEGFGYDILLTDRHVDDAEHSFPLDDTIDDRILRLAKMPLPELELWATVHFVQTSRPKWDEDKVVDASRTLKRKFSKEKIRCVYQKLQDTGLLHVPSDAARQN